MSITKYQIFVKVAELGSLTRAAEALGYTQPAVSHSISSLESRFGFPLFYRSRDACRLTENGERLLDACREILRGEEEIEATVHALNGVLTGSIRVGSLRSMLTEFVPRVIYRFSQAYPQIGLTRDKKSRTFSSNSKKKSHFADFLTEQTLDFVIHRFFCGLAEMHTDDIGGLANLLSDSRASGGVGCGIVHSKSSCK